MTVRLRQILWLRLLLLPAVTVALFAAALAAASMAVGQEQPPSNWLTLLQLDHCELPCWIGIVPGTTTAEEAGDHIRRAFGEPDRYWVIPVTEYAFHVVHLPTRASFDVDLSASSLASAGETRTVVSMVSITNFVQQGLALSGPSLPDLTRILGHPDHVALNRPGQPPSLIFIDSSVSVSLVGQRCMRRLSQPVGGILISGRRLDRIFVNVLPWRGYGACYEAQLDS